MCLQLELIYSRIICHAPACHAPIAAKKLSKMALENGKWQLKVGFSFYFLGSMKRSIEGSKVKKF